MQSCLRDICYLAAVHGFEVRVRHIVGVENRAADHLSRWHSYYKNTVNFKSCIEGVGGVFHVFSRPVSFNFRIRNSRTTM